MSALCAELCSATASLCRPAVDRLSSPRSVAASLASGRRLVLLVHLPLLASSLLLLLAVLLVGEVPSVAAMMTGCSHTAANFRPSLVPRPSLALYDFGTQHFNATLCLLTFAQLQDAFSNSASCFHLLPLQVLTCPQHCLRVLNGSSHSPPLVLGSYPYHPSSSVCLAAIHSGIIAAEAGGGVFAERFYPETWANDSSQSIFPRGSHQASLSNAVQSAAVPDEATLTPAPLDSYSWTVRSRGLGGRQRQIAPFPPRAGHAHLNFPLRQHNVSAQHLIVGGHNATHRFNDVWLYQSYHDSSSLLSSQARNGRWLRLPDAPFSPRSEMAVHWLPLSTGRDVIKDRFDPSRSWLLLLFGGQTADSCGQRVLGQCSDEVWQLNMTHIDDSSGPELASLGISFQWSTAPVGRLPFGGRCGVTPIVDQRWMTSRQARIVGLAGGQLNYTDTERCSAPIETGNDVWYTSWPDLFEWRRGRDAPFSPRRSMQEDDAYLNSDDEFRSVSNRYEVESLSKSTSLAGGIRYIAHRVDNATGKAVVTRAELYADVYSCTLPTPEYEPAGALLDCDWAHSYPLANVSVPPPYLPTGSLPLPSAYGAMVGSPAALRNSLTRYGGATSPAALLQWLSTPPTGAADATHPTDWSAAPSNVSLIAQPLFVDGLAAASLAAGAARLDGSRELMPGRYHLPLAYVLNETELNSDASDFVRGSAAVLTHLMFLDRNKLQPQLSSLHLQPQQMAQTPAEQSYAVPQAASALNTTRPSFDFSMRRRGHSQQQTLDTTYVTAGQTGQLYLNDWIATTAQGCLWPMDPSYGPLLGPLSEVWDISDTRWILQRTGNGPVDYHFLDPNESPMFAPYGQVSVRCATGHHFSPPMEDDMALLTCTGAALWLDLTLGAVRRCVPDVVQCEWPFVDAGFGQCVDPQPAVSRVELYTVAALGQSDTPQARNTNNATIVNLPSQWYPSLRHQQLYVYGRWLTPPLVITVQGRDCQLPLLHNATRHCTADGQLCRDFASVASCTLRPMYDWISPTGSLPVALTVGRRRRLLSDLTQGTAFDPQSAAIFSMSISFAPPSIVRLTAAACSSSSTGLELLDCPLDGPFDVRVCGENIPLYLNNGEPPRLSLSGSSTPLRCGGWAREFHVLNDTLCNDRLGDLPCWQQYVCSTCRVQPLTGVGHVLRIVLSNRLTNELQNLNPNTTARLSFTTCRPGTRAELYVAAGGSVRQLCVDCEPGYSTLGLPDQRTCTPCAPGSYSAHNASAVCLPCPVGQAASQQNSTQCVACSANAWSRFEGASECNECGDALYKRLSPLLNSSAALHELPSCEVCPAGAQCDRNGTIVAHQGSFLAIDSSTGFVSSVECALSACVEAADDEQCRLAAASFTTFNTSLPVPRIGATGPAVINCCGPHRRPPVTEDGSVNVLCAQCVDGYTVVHSECIPCSSVHWGRLIGLLLLAVLLLYLLHRLFHDVSGSATMPILTYFVQMSSLFLTQDALLVILNVASVDLVADGLPGGGASNAGSDVLRACIVPFSDVGKMLARLFSPAVFCGLLATLLAVQLALRATFNAHFKQRSLELQQRSTVLKAYRLLLPAVSQQELPARAAQHELQRRRAPRTRKVSSTAPKQSTTSQQLQALNEPLVPSQSADDGKDECADQAHSSASDAAVNASGSVTNDTVRGILVFYLRTLVRLALYSYNTVTLVSLAAFRTVAVGEWGRRLQQYPTVDTGSSQYKALAALFTTVLVVVVAGGPLALLAYLAHCYRRGIVGRAEHQPADEQPRAVRASDTPAVLLTASFKPRFWWYPVAILLRRLVLIVVLTFAQRGVYSWLTIINYLFLTLHMLLWPYLHPRDSAQELATLLALSMQTAVLSAYPSPQSRPDWLRGLLWLLFVLPFCLAAGLAWWGRCYRLIQQAWDRWSRWRSLHSERQSSLFSTHHELAAIDR